MKSDLNILYTCDNAFLPLTGISMASVIDNNPDSLIRFYIATESEDNDYFRKLKDFYKDNKKVEIRYLDCQHCDSLLEEKKLDKWGSNSFYVYWKLFAYDLLDVDTIWYLDSDVLCLKKIEIPQISKPVGACLDSAHACFNKAAGIDENYYYFNTGSLFVDVRKWKEERCIELVKDHIRNMKRQPLMCDQDILCASLQDKIEVLDPKFDYLVGYDYYGIHNTFEMYSLNKKPFYKEEQITAAKDKVIFYHCLGGVFGRPWEENNDSPIGETFKRYKEVSAWPDYSRKRSISTLFKVEKAMEILPSPIYNRVHNLAMRIYIKRLGSK